jgi:hypothetical protein
MSPFRFVYGQLVRELRVGDCASGDQSLHEVATIGHYSFHSHALIPAVLVTFPRHLGTTGTYQEIQIRSAISLHDVIVVQLVVTPV